MSVRDIIQHAVEKNPLAMKEALGAEMQDRIRQALEEKMTASLEEADDEEEDDEDDEDDEDEDEDDLDEAVTGEKHISSGKAQHGLDGRAEMKAHADYMQKKHGVTTKFHGGADGDELSYHGPKANVKKAIVNHYDGDHEHAKEEHPHLWK
jgi:hypothetical protein